VPHSPNNSPIFHEFILMKAMENHSKEDKKYLQEENYQEKKRKDQQIFDHNKYRMEYWNEHR